MSVWRGVTIRVMGAPEVRPHRRVGSDALIEELAASQDPVLAYKARLLSGLDPGSATARSMRERIPGSPLARVLLRVFEQDARTLHHTYRKWQGPHWTLTCLAMIDYPVGRRAAAAAGPPGPRLVVLQALPRAAPDGGPPRAGGPVRHCASMDGNAIWYSLRLGLEEDRTREVVDRLIGWQWSDGGWNCDKRPEATHSSFQESLIPARGLWAYGRAHDYAPALEGGSAGG